MPEKVVILEVKEEYALVMRQGGEIIRIRRKDGMRVGDKIYILPEDRYTGQPQKKIESKKKEGRLYRLTALAAMVALVICMSLPNFTTQSSAVLSMDAQYGVQMEVDKNYKILKVVTRDGDIPENLLNRLVGQNVLEIGPELIELLGKGPFLVAYAPKNGGEDQQAEADLRGLFADRELIYLQGDDSDVAAAKERNESLGYYMLSLLMSDEHMEHMEGLRQDYLNRDEDKEDVAHHGLTEEQLEEMELHQMIAEVQKNPDCMEHEDFREEFYDKLEEKDEELNQKPEDDDREEQKPDDDDRKEPKPEDDDREEQKPEDDDHDSEDEQESNAEQEEDEPEDD